MSETPEMVERVARAIYEDRNGPGCVPWSRRDASHKAPYRKDARAAMQALCEPNDEMIWAGGTAMHDKQDDSLGVFRAYLIAALSDSRTGAEQAEGD